MTPKLTRFWNNELDTPGYFRVELRADFDNDRHHAVVVAEPHGPHELARALETLAAQIATDPHLQPTST